MKKLISLLALSLILVACGKDDDSAATGIMALNSNQSGQLELFIEEARGSQCDPMAEQVPAKVRVNGKRYTVSGQNGALPTTQVRNQIEQIKNSQYTQNFNQSTCIATYNVNFSGTLTRGYVATNSEWGGATLQDVIVLQNIFANGVNNNNNNNNNGF